MRCFLHSEAQDFGQRKMHILWILQPTLTRQCKSCRIFDLQKCGVVGSPPIPAKWIWIRAELSCSSLNTLALGCQRDRLSLMAPMSLDFVEPSIIRDRGRPWCELYRWLAACSAARREVKSSGQFFWKGNLMLQWVEFLWVTNVSTVVTPCGFEVEVKVLFIDCRIPSGEKLKYVKKPLLS